MHTTSPDQSLIATVPDGRTIMLALSTGQPKPAELEGHEDTILHLEFSADSWFLASASADHTIRIWQAHNGAAPKRDVAAHILVGHRGPVNHLTFVASDENLLVSGSDDRTARLWNFKEGRLIQEFVGHTDAIYHVSISPDGSTITTTSDDGSERLWDVNTGRVIRKFPTATRDTPSIPSTSSPMITKKVLTRHQHPILDLAFSPDGLTLASMSEESVRVWNGTTGRFIKTLSTGPIEDDVPTRRLVFSSDSNFLIIQLKHNYQELWDLEKGQRIFQAAGQWPSFLTHGQRMLYGVTKESGHYECRVWDIAQAKVLSRLQLPNSAGEIRAITASPDDETVHFFLVKTDWDGNAAGPGIIHTWNWCSGKETVLHYSANLGFSRRVSHVLISATTRWALEVPVREPPTANHVHQPPFSEAPIPIHLTKGPAYWYSHERDVLPPPLTHHWIESTKQPASYVFSPTSDMLATTSNTGHVSLWDLESGTEIHQLQGPKEIRRFSHVTFSCDGEFVAAGSALCDTTTFWHVKTGKHVKTYTGKNVSVTRVCFSPEGDYITSGCSDGSIHIRPIAADVNRLTQR